MNINDQKVSTELFEIGLALKLKKISLKEVDNYLPIKKIDELSSIIEKDSSKFGTWDDSHITPGDRLKAALELHDITQTKLATHLNISRQKVNDLLKGRVAITRSMAQKISDLFEVDYRVFL